MNKVYGKIIELTRNMNKVYGKIIIIGKIN